MAPSGARPGMSRWAAVVDANSRVLIPVMGAWVVDIAVAASKGERCGAQAA